MPLMKAQKSCKSARKRRRTAWGVAPRAVKYMRKRQAQTAALQQASTVDKSRELERVERLGASDHANGCHRGWRQPTQELQAAYDRGWHPAQAESELEQAAQQGAIDYLNNRYMPRQFPANELRAAYELSWEQAREQSVRLVQSLPGAHLRGV